MSASRAIGRVVRVRGANSLCIAVDEEHLPLVARPGVYVKARNVAGEDIIGLVLGFALLEELYLRARIIELEHFGEREERPTVTRNELQVTIVGSLRRTDRGLVFTKGVSALPRPGTLAYLVSEDELSQVFGGGDLPIGELATCEGIEVRLDLNELCSKHAAVLAMTGMGKSNTVAVLLAEILQRFPYAVIVVFDAHNEYIPYAQQFGGKARVFAASRELANYLQQVHGIQSEPFEAPLWMMRFEEICSLVRLGSSAHKQRRFLREALRRIRRQHARSYFVQTDTPVHFTIDELLFALNTGSSSGRDSRIELIDKVEELKENPDLAFITQPQFSEMVFQREVQQGDVVEASYRTLEALANHLLRPGVNIVALSGLPRYVQQAVVSTYVHFIWRTAWEARLSGTALPTLIVVEEAHAFAPAGTWSASRRALEYVAREGRKAGVGLILVSQRPRGLDENILSQCGTLIVLRTVNPSDQRYIRDSAEEIGEELVRGGLSSLPRGTALITGHAIAAPALVRIYHFTERYGFELGGKDVDFRTQWQQPLQIPRFQRPPRPPASNTADSSSSTDSS